MAGGFEQAFGLGFDGIQLEAGSGYYFVEGGEFGYRNLVLGGPGDVGGAGLLWANAPETVDSLALASVVIEEKMINSVVVRIRLDYGRGRRGSCRDRGSGGLTELRCTPTPVSAGWSA